MTETSDSIDNLNDNFISQTDKLNETLGDIKAVLHDIKEELDNISRDIRSNK